MNSAPVRSNSLVDVIEAVLNFSFTVENIEQFVPTTQALHELALAVQSFLEEYRVPPKKRGEQRPYVYRFPELNTHLGMDYGLSNNLPRFGEMTDSIKKALLFSHSFCIHDPLHYLMDFFRINPDGEIARSEIPTVKALLLEYAGLGELIRQHILIPLHDSSFGIQRPHLRFSLSDEDQTKLLSTFPDRQHSVTRIGHIIRMQEYMAKIQDGNIDLFFPNAGYIDVYHALLGLSMKRLSGKSIEPYYAAILLDLPGINPDAVSIDDLISIRRNGALFREWRNFLKRVFQQIKNSPNRDSLAVEDWKSFAQAAWEMHKNNRAFAQPLSLPAFQNHLSALGICNVV